MTRSKSGAVFTALVIAAFAVLTPLCAVADSPHPPGENRVEIEVDAPTFTIPDPGGYGYDVWVALYTKAGNNPHKLWDGSLEPGTVVTSHEYNHQGNERDISHVDLYGARNATTTTTTTLPPTTTTTTTTVPPTTVPPTTVPPTTVPPTTALPTTVPPTTVPPMQPTIPPTQPTVPPTQPTVPPTQPTIPPTDPPTTPPTTVPTDVLPWEEETTSVPATLAPPLGRIPATGPAALAPIAVIAGSMLLSGGVAIAATRRKTPR